MEKEDLLALRFPSRVPVRFHVLQPEGGRIEGGPWSAQGVDVSRTGVRLEAGGLPKDLVKRLGDYEAELRIEVFFESPGGDLPVVGVCRWLKDFGASRWLLGIEYLPVDRGRGSAIAAHFERQYTRPKVYRAVGLTAVLAAAVLAVMVVQARQQQSAVVEKARDDLHASIQEKESLSILISALESRLQKSAGEFGADAPPELVREVASLRGELEEVREEIGRRSLALAEVAKEERKGESGRRLRRGNDFFDGGNLSAALLEYEKVVEIDPKIHEPYLKLGIIHEFQDRPLRALEAYGRYIELRRDAPDWYEVNARVERLMAEVSSGAIPEVSAGAVSVPGADVETGQARKAGGAGPTPQNQDPADAGSTSSKTADMSESP